MVVYEGTITNVMFHDDPTYVDLGAAMVEAVLDKAQRTEATARLEPAR